jgi:sulfite dehydrogenase (cytochrome) subunit B
MRTLIFAAVALLVAGQALAEERPIELDASAGHEKVEANCGVCHSLDYIPMNSPFLEGKWDAVVTKMIRVMGAPISDTDAKEIAEYLKAHYGKPEAAKPPEPAKQTAEDICKREQEKLVQLRARPVRAEVVAFVRELQCRALRPQALRLSESVSGGGPQTGDDSSCKREEAILIHLRAQPVRVDVENFAHALQCFALRAQAERLLESVGD